MTHGTGIEPYDWYCRVCGLRWNYEYGVLERVHDDGYLEALLNFPRYLCHHEHPVLFVDGRPYFAAELDAMPEIAHMTVPAA